jgi:hypothetical protein
MSKTTPVLSKRREALPPQFAIIVTSSTPDNAPYFTAFVANSWINSAKPGAVPESTCASGCIGR